MVRGEIERDERAQRVPDYYRALQPQLVDQLRQIFRVNGHAVALLRLVAIAATTQIVGNDAMIGCQFVGEGLEAESVRREAMNADHRRAFFAPLHPVQRRISGNGKFISYRTNRHSSPRVVERCATWRLRIL